MANIKYRIRGIQENSPIYLRFSNGRECNFELRSGYFCKPDYFNNKLGKIRDVAEFKDKVNLQTSLNELENEVRKTFNETSTFNKDWLRKQINKHHGSISDEDRPRLTSVIEMYIRHKEYSSETEVSTSTLKSYKTALMKIENFQSYKNRVYYIDEVGFDFKDEFVEWARGVANYMPSTYGKTIKQLKTICRYAKNKKKLQVDDSFFERDIKSGKVVEKNIEKFPYLSPSELKTLMELNGSDYITNARDWLVISCLTACRVSDLMKLTKKNIVTTIGGEKAIQYTQDKTGRTVDVPILPFVIAILEERGGFPRPISHQKYNNYIKEVCKQAGITEDFNGSKMDKATKRKVFGVYPKNELVTSHIGRRSFATNHYGKFPNFSIMLVTGHTTEKQFLDYIGKRNTDHISDFNKYYNEMYSEEEMTKKIDN